MCSLSRFEPEREKAAQAVMAHKADGQAESSDDDSDDDEITASHEEEALETVYRDVRCASNRQGHCCVL